MNCNSKHSTKINSKQFKICQIIGEGATSTVYKAIANNNLNSNKVVVAIKVFLNSKMKNESKILSELESEHIVRFYCELPPNSLVLEHCDSNLIAFLNDHELDLKGIKKIIRMVLVGTHEIHRKGIIHRDLKLGNILVKDDCVKICDFGLSCFKNENDFSFCGTKDYLAPELIGYKNSTTYNNHDYNNPITLTNPITYNNHDYTNSTTYNNDSIRYDEKIDIYAIGIIYKILLSRKKNVDLSEINVDESTKDLIMKMTKEDSKQRFSAYEALSHQSFSDLFVEVPDFRSLKDFSKVMKYGRIYKRFINQGPREGHVIGIEYENANTSENKNSNGNYNVIEVACLRKDAHFSANISSNTHMPHKPSPCPNTYLHSNASDNFWIEIFLNNSKIDKILLSNTPLKYFNYLASYFKLICDKTVKFRDFDGEFNYFETVSGIKVLKNSNFTVKNQSGKLLIEKENGENLKNCNDFNLYFENIFNKFDCRKNKLNLQSNLLSIEQPTQNISHENLFKKFQFCVNLGWCIRDGSRFTILLNEGMRIAVFIEDFTVKIDDFERISIERVETRILKILKEFLSKVKI